MLLVSDKSDSVNERTQEISDLMKLHIQRVWQMPINLLGNWLIVWVWLSLALQSIAYVRLRSDLFYYVG